MILLYNSLLYLLSPLIFVKLLMRGFKARAYWHRWSERLGFLPFDMPKPCIWIHAVSVGEAQAAVPLVKALRRQYPHHSILVTSTTPTGSARVQESLGAQVRHVYLPYDFPGAVRRFLRQVKPSLAIIMETELWPNLFSQCAQLQIPIVLANARLSPGSTKGYLRFRAFTRQVLANAQMIAAQSDMDAERFVSIGGQTEKVRVTGSIKFDLQIPSSVMETANLLRSAIGASRSVLIGASTHEGEEEVLLDVYLKLKKNFSDLVLILVPRHPERFAAVSQLCRKTGLRVMLKSESNPDLSRVDIFVGDTMGDLPVLYAASDVAFVGGSLVPVGGHNLLEPAALRLAVVSGSQLFNFREISQLLLDAGGLKLVSNAQELQVALQDIFANPTVRQGMGDAARTVVEKNRGALNRLMKLLKETIQLQ